MQLLEEAKRVIEAEPDCSAQTLSTLLELMEQAEDREAAEIGMLVEECISRAPLEAVQTISKPPNRFFPSVWYR